MGRDTISNEIVEFHIRLLIGLSGKGLTPSGKCCINCVYYEDIIDFRGGPIYDSFWRYIRELERKV